MIKDYMAIIYLSDNKKNISSLTKVRPISSILVGGSYRIIDFSLSNIVNAGIRNVALFYGNEEIGSLLDHIGIGKEWDLRRKKDGIFFFKQMIDENSSLNTTRIQKNIDYFLRSNQEKIVVLNGHMVCNLDIADLIEKHEKSEKDITLVYKRVGNANECFNGCSSVTIDENQRVTGIGKNFFFRKEENISLDAFVINKELALKLLLDSVQEGKYNILPELISRKIHSLNINTYEFNGYLQNISSTKEYYDFNMNLLDKDIREDIFGLKTGRKIFTKIKDTPPTLFKENAEIENSLISNGCIIEGKVKNSILSRGAIVEKGAILEDCIILQDCYIKAGANLKNVIIDKNNIINENEKLIASKEYPLVIEKSINWDRKKYQTLIDYIKN